MILHLWGMLSYFALAAVAPYYLFRMMTGSKYRAGIRQRLALYTRDELARLRSDDWIWIHAVSVGELQAAKPLLSKLREAHPQRRLLATTVTETGQNLAKGIQEIDYCCYLPLDIPPLCARFMRAAQPSAGIILETELWPNIIREAGRFGCPLFLANARISDRSFPRYKAMRWFFSSVLKRFESIAAQSQTDLERLQAIGAEASKLTVAGNLKFDAAADTSNQNARGEWRERLGIDARETLIVAGSTFPGEEALLTDAVRAIQDTHPNARLLIAPRHIERIEEIEKELSALGHLTLRRTDLENSDSFGGQNLVLLLDTIGELREIYAAADLVVIGKSLLAKGGQNPLEAAAWGRAVVFGPNMQNFRDISSMLTRADAAVQASHADDLKPTIQALLNDPDRLRLLGQNALRVVDENRGAADRIVAILSARIKV